MILDGNQPEEIEEELDYFLPEGYVEGEEESTDESEESTEEEVEEAQEEEVDEEVEVDEESEEEVDNTIEANLEDLEVKYLHETKALKDIPRDELKSYVQKGMNHDRIQEKLTMANDQIDSFNEVAEMFDMDLSEVIEILKEQHFTGIAEKEDRQVSDVRREYEGNRKDRNAKMYEKFLEKYPDVKTDDLPQDVIDSVRNGEDLVKSYDKHVMNNETKIKDDKINTMQAQIDELTKKLGVKNQNTKTKKKSVVKKTSGSKVTVDDDFLAGFNGD